MIVEPTAKRCFITYVEKNGHVAKVCIKTLMSSSNIKLNTHLLINIQSLYDFDKSYGINKIDFCKEKL